MVSHPPIFHQTVCPERLENSYSTIGIFQPYDRDFHFHYYTNYPTFASSNNKFNTLKI